MHTAVLANQINGSEGEYYPIIGEFEEDSDIYIDKVLELKDARTKLEESQFDLVILDIQLPNRIGKSAIKNGGIGLLNEINVIEKLHKPTYVIGITSYSESIKDFEVKFQNEAWTLIKYDKVVTTWKEQLRNKIKYIISWKEQFINSIKFPLEYDYDIAIVTAVEKELKSIKNLCVDWKVKEVPNDSEIYYEGIIESKIKKVKVVLAKQHQMGMPAASVLSMKMIHNFHPKYICMIGIAAGKRGKVNLGDILVAGESWDYGSGKIRESDEKENNYLFEPEPHQLSIDPDIRKIFSCNFEDILLEIRKEWNKHGYLVKHDLNIYVGAIASGAAVIQNEGVVKDFIDAHNRGLLGLDMETYGVYIAAENSSKPRPQFFSIKSVCDFADKEKNDNFQSYAAYTSAQFFYYFVKNYL